jgi:hypothetical protein
LTPSFPSKQSKTLAFNKSSNISTPTSKSNKPTSHRWQYFQTAWDRHPQKKRWLQDAKKIVQALWDTTYRDLSIPGRFDTPSPRPDEDEEEGPVRKRARLSTFAEYQDKHRIQPTTLQDDYNLHGIDEWASWQSHTRLGDSEVRDPIAYWLENEVKYPRLSRMALDVMTVPAMSAECERLFSAVGLMVTPLRNRLDAGTIGLVQSLRSWLQAGLIGDLDAALLEVTCQEVMCKDETLDGSQERPQSIS